MDEEKKNKLFKNFARKLNKEYQQAHTIYWFEQMINQGEVL